MTPEPAVVHTAPPARVTMDPAGLVMAVPPDEALDSAITSTQDHFVLAHLGIARCDATTWTVTVDGAVERELVLPLRELRERPQHTVTTAMECAGDPEAPDRPTRIVGNATWTGVPLAALLHEAGLHADDGTDPTAGFVWATGEDSGRYAGEDVAAYVKDIPLAAALDDALLALEMNGEPLTPEHGHPVRLIVPGYYGTNAVKWLSRLTVHAERPSGLFTGRLYTGRRDGRSVPVWGMAVNSRLLAPREGDTVAGPTVLRGWAWGEHPVARVDVSVDGGRSWAPAELAERAAGGRPWQRFEARWTPSGPGPTEIVVRAADTTGARQPDELHINQVHRVRVHVGDERSSS